MPGIDVYRWMFIIMSLLLCILASLGALIDINNKRIGNITSMAIYFVLMFIALTLWKELG